MTGRFSSRIVGTGSGKTELSPRVGPILTRGTECDLFGSHDEAIASLVQAQFERTEDALYAALRRARRSGELEAGVALRDSARHLTVVAHGLLVSLKGGVPPKHARIAVRTVLAALALWG